MGLSEIRRLKQLEDEMGVSEAATITVRVLDVTPMTNKGKLLALASAEIEVDGITFTLEGIQVIRMKDPATGAEATGVDAPRYRAPDGSWRLAVHLPDELHKPLAHAILDECCDHGITYRKSRDAVKA